MAEAKFTISLLEGRRKLALEIVGDGALEAHVSLNAASVDDLIRLLAEARANMLGAAPSDRDPRFEVKIGPQKGPKPNTSRSAPPNKPEPGTDQLLMTTDEDLYTWLTRKKVASSLR